MADERDQAMVRAGPGGYPSAPAGGILGPRPGISLMRSMHTLLSLLLLTMLGAGCTQMRTLRAAVLRTGQHISDEPVAIDVAGPVMVDVESFGGDVTVIADPELTEAVITVTRRAIHGLGRVEEASASLEQIDYAIEVVPGALGQILLVRTSTTHGEPHFQRADVVIELPEVDGLTVRTNNGNVTANSVYGEIDIVTTDGDVRVMTPWAMNRPVTIINNAGDIDYRIRGESTAAFDCASVRGKVSHHVRFGELIVHPGTAHNSLLATLNGGDNRVLLRAADGDIRIAVVADPIAIGAYIRH
jgi:hypothetical protein